MWNNKISMMMLFSHVKYHYWQNHYDSGEMDTMSLLNKGIGAQGHEELNPHSGQSANGLLQCSKGVERNIKVICYIIKA